jgi:hypothetical protein
MQAYSRYVGETQITKFTEFISLGEVFSRRHCQLGNPVRSLYVLFGSLLESRSHARLSPLILSIPKPPDARCSGGRSDHHDAMQSLPSGRQLLGA